MKSQDKKEDHLLDELETMYQRVAQSEKSEAEGERKEALEGYFEALQVPPDAPLNEIKESYERLVNFWNPDRFADKPSFREKAERKLTEITHAYEKILAYWESKPTSVEPPQEIPEEPYTPFPEEEVAEEEVEEAEEVVEEESRPFFRSKTFLVLAGTAFAVLLLAIFLWPTLYHYDTVKSGSKTYQVRTSRITGSLTYFDGGKWNDPPIPVGRPFAPRPLAVASPPAQQPASPAKEGQPAPAAKPAPAERSTIVSKEEAPSGKPVAQPAKAPALAAKQAISPLPAKPAPAERPTIVSKEEAPSGKPVAQPAKAPVLAAKQATPPLPTKPEPAERPTIASKREVPAGKQASQAAKAKPYGIQISSIRDLGMAKGIVNGLKQEGAPVYLAKVNVKGQGVWYRIYIGHFADRTEAARYMNEKKIKELFPGSFIQKVS